MPDFSSHLSLSQDEAILTKDTTSVPEAMGIILTLSAKEDFTGSASLTDVVLDTIGPVLHGQFLILTKNKAPVAYVLWAKLSKAHRAVYPDFDEPLTISEFNSGEYPILTRLGCPALSPVNIIRKFHTASPNFGENQPMELIDHVVFAK